MLAIICTFPLSVFALPQPLHLAKRNPTDDDGGLKLATPVVPKSPSPPHSSSSAGETTDDDGGRNAGESSKDNRKQQKSLRQQESLRIVRWNRRRRPPHLARSHLVNIGDHNKPKAPPILPTISESGEGCGEGNPKSGKGSGPRNSVGHESSMDEKTGPRFTFVGNHEARETNGPREEMKKNAEEK